MKYFVTSDLHSFCTPLLNSLQNVGYDRNNPNHTLVILGDIFDRGTETVALYNFLKSIPQERLILVKGNHEYLFDQLLNKELPDSYDFGNGTVYTFCQLAFKSLHVARNNFNLLQELDYEISYASLWKAFSDDPNKDLDSVKYAKTKWRNIVKRVKDSFIYKWYKNLNWVNYWETANFIGVHSFVPVKLKENLFCSKEKQLNAIYDGWTEYFNKNEDWRNADSWSWELATWGCPYVYMDASLLPEKGRKTLICGHYKCSAFHSHYNSTSTGDNHTIYYSKNLIAIDSTVALSNFTNVLVIDEDNSCFDQYNDKLNI